MCLQSAQISDQQNILSALVKWNEVQFDFIYGMWTDVNLCENPKLWENL